VRAVRIDSHVEDEGPVFAWILTGARLSQGWEQQIELLPHLIHGPIWNAGAEREHGFPAHQRQQGEIRGVWPAAAQQFLSTAQPERRGANGLRQLIRL